MRCVYSMEPGPFLLLHMLGITTQFLRLYLCHVDRSCHSSGNHAPGHSMFSRTAREMGPCQLVQSFISQKSSIPWSFQSAGVSNKMGKFLLLLLLMPHTLCCRLWILLLTQKRGKIYHAVLSPKSQAPLEITVYFSQ